MKNLTRDEAAERAAQLRVESYGVRLDLTAAPAATRFGTRTRVVFHCATDGADTFVEHLVPVCRCAVCPPGGTSSRCGRSPTTA